MKNLVTTKHVLLIAYVATNCSIALGHNAGDVGSATPGHLKDSNNMPVVNTVGECWHLGATAASPDCAVKPAPVSEAPIPGPVASAPSAPPPPIKQTVNLQGDALFDFDKATLRQAHISELDEAIDRVRKGGVSTQAIEIVGHTDSIGTPSYNDKLSLRRAQAVKDYMVAKGVDPDKIKVEAKGEREPVADNKTKEGRSKNRRVHVVFTGQESVKQ